MKGHFRIGTANVLCLQKVLDQLVKVRKASLLLTQFLRFNMFPELANML